MDEGLLNKGKRRASSRGKSSLSKFNIYFESI